MGLSIRRLLLLRLQWMYLIVGSGEPTAACASQQGSLAIRVGVSLLGGTSEQGQLFALQQYVP